MCDVLEKVRGEGNLVRELLDIFGVPNGVSRTKMMRRGINRVMTQWCFQTLTVGND